MYADDKLAWRHSVEPEPAHIFFILRPYTPRRFRELGPNDESALLPRLGQR